MHTVASKDGTTIAFDRSGDGPAVILVGGAIQHRAIDPSTARLAELLSSSVHRGTTTTVGAGATAATRRRMRSSARSTTSTP